MAERIHCVRCGGRGVETRTATHRVYTCKMAGHGQIAEYPLTIADRIPVLVETETGAGEQAGLSKFEREILKVLREEERDEREILRALGVLLKLTRIEIQFAAKGKTPMGTSPGTPAPVAGPVVLTALTMIVIASILGFDQFGNPWTGAIPPVKYSIDNPSFATSAPNADGVTDTVTPVANGVANLTASLTTAEGLALTDTESVTVALAAAPPPPTPVLSSIKVAFAPAPAVAAA
jgi:hypothetical protein